MASNHLSSRSVSHIETTGDKIIVRTRGRTVGRITGKTGVMSVTATLIGMAIIAATGRSVVMANNRTIASAIVMTATIAMIVTTGRTIPTATSIQMPMRTATSIQTALGIPSIPIAAASVEQSHVSNAASATKRGPINDPTTGARIAGTFGRIGGHVPIAPFV